MESTRTCREDVLRRRAARGSLSFAQRRCRSMLERGLNVKCDAGEGPVQPRFRIPAAPREDLSNLTPDQLSCRQTLDQGFEPNCDPGPGYTPRTVIRRPGQEQRPQPAVVSRPAPQEAPPCPCKNQDDCMKRGNSWLCLE